MRSSVPAACHAAWDWPWLPPRPREAGAAAAVGLVTALLLLSGYLVKCQYSGSSVYSALKVTSFSLLLTAWIPYGAG